MDSRNRDVTKYFYFKMGRFLQHKPKVSHNSTMSMMIAFLKLYLIHQIFSEVDIIIKSRVFLHFIFTRIQLCEMRILCFDRFVKGAWFCFEIIKNLPVWHNCGGWIVFQCFWVYGNSIEFMIWCLGLLWK